MPATLTDIALLFPGIPWVLAQTIFSIPLSVFRGKNGAPTTTGHVINAAFRAAFSTLSINQLQLLVPSFVSSYESWCKKNKLPVQIVDIPNTTVKGFWIGDKETATQTMVYYHGGGFVMPGLDNHLDLLSRFQKWSNNKVAIFCVAYTLAPEKKYPTQIGQAVEGLRYVLSLPGQSPERIILAGDSAGGNLVLAVLSHISGHAHPQAEIVKPLDVSKKFKAAMLIAPWVSSDATKFASMEKYVGRDILSPAILSCWFGTYKNVADDEYSVPELAAPEWWNNTKVSTVLTVAGEHECLLDNIKSWVKKFRQGAPGIDFKYVEGKAETHDAPLLPKSEKELKGNEETCQEAALRAWIQSQVI